VHAIETAKQHFTRAAQDGATPKIAAMFESTMATSDK
jgi:hypothetical protein